MNVAKKILWLLRRALKYIVALAILFFIFTNLEESARIAKNAYQRVDKMVTEATTDYEVASKELEMVKLVEVIDGDTLLVQKINSGEQEKVRLLEIDTPESVHADESKNNEYGEIASDFTKSYLQNYSYIFLSYDRERTDQYGRTLAYVWLEEGVDTASERDIRKSCLNAIILDNGMARVTVYAPNTQYETLFTEIKENAKANNVGLWAEEGYREIAGE